MAMRFVEEYIKDSTSAKKAAVRAGYSIETSPQIASRLLADKRIKRLISESQKKGAEICGITAARVMQELALIAFAKPGDVVRQNSDGEAEVDLNDLSKDSFSGTEVNVSTVNSGGRKSRSVSIKTVKVADKLSALGLLGKQLGMFKEQVEVNHSMSLQDMIEQSYKTEELSALKPETVN